MGLVDADAVAGHVGDDGGDGHALHDVAAVEVVALLALERFAEGGLVVAPVEEVAAADVLPTGEVDRAGGVGDLLQVAEVVAAVPVDGAVDVVPAALGRDEVVAGAVFVGDEFFAEFVGLHEVVVEVPHLEDSMKHLCGALGWGGRADARLPDRDGTAWCEKCAGIDWGAGFWPGTVGWRRDEDWIPGEGSGMTGGACSQGRKRSVFDGLLGRRVRGLRRGGGAFVIIGRQRRRFVWRRTLKEMA